MKFGVGKSTVHDIHKRKDKIRQFALMHNEDVICKRRRVDQKLSETAETIKQETKCEEEEISTEEFDYQEITDQDYEIVYESNLSANEELIQETKKVISSPRAKRKSKNLTFREKYDLILQIESGLGVPCITEAYGIGRTTVYDIIKRKQEIIDFIEKSDDVDRKTFKKSSFPVVEERVIKWCESKEHFTKHEFYDRAKSAFESARDKGQITSPSSFVGSWSWAKRFFKRHPDLKKKLRTIAGEPIDPLEISMSNAEFSEEQDHPGLIEMKNHPEPPVVGKRMRFLNLSEKLQVLEDITAGKQVAAVAEQYGVSKTTIYDIFRRRQELGDRRLTRSSSLRKVVKQPRYPELELELLRWCLVQKSFPLSNVLIADKASCIFDELGIKGSFSPTSWWAKKFVLRHPELCEKQGIECDVDIAEEPATEETFEDAPIEESRDEEITTGDYEFTEEDVMSSTEYQEEYIVEALEMQQDDEELDVVAAENIKHEDNFSIDEAEIVEEEAACIPFVPDHIALKSLKILIKYSEQQGHKHMIDRLIEYHRELQSDDS